MTNNEQTAIGVN